MALWTITEGPSTSTVGPGIKSTRDIGKVKTYNIGKLLILLITGSEEDTQQQKPGLEMYEKPENHQTAGGHMRGRCLEVVHQRGTNL